MLAIKENEMENMRRKIDEYEKRIEDMTATKSKNDASTSPIKRKADANTYANKACEQLEGHRNDEHIIKKLDNIFEIWLITRNSCINENKTRMYKNDKGRKTWAEIAKGNKNGMRNSEKRKQTSTAVDHNYTGERQRRREEEDGTQIVTQRDWTTR